MTTRSELIRTGVIQPRSDLELFEAFAGVKPPKHPNQQSRVNSRINAILARRATFKAQK